MKRRGETATVSFTVKKAGERGVGSPYISRTKGTDFA